MRKITLQLESLAVESFDTTAPGPAEGTVVGHGRTDVSCDSCIVSVCTCPGYNTCAQSCIESCPWQNSCDDSCNCGTDPFSCIYSACTSCC